jgi:hypothetical protein
LPPSINTSIGTPSNFCDTCVSFSILALSPYPPCYTIQDFHVYQST